MDASKEILEEELVQKFNQEIKYYKPDWKKIIYANQSDEELTLDEILDKKVEVFKKRMREMRKSRGLTQEMVAKMLNCSKQYISKMENSIINIPIKELGDIERFFDVPIAYLIGLTDNELDVPDDTECYFWENPNSQYNIIKSKVVTKRLINPFESWGTPPETIEKRVFNEIKDHYDILTLIDDIMRCSKEKRERLILIMKYLNKIL